MECWIDGVMEYGFEPLLQYSMLHYSKILKATGNRRPMANYQRVKKMWQRRCSIALLLLAATMGLNEANAAAKESLRAVP